MLFRRVHSEGVVQEPWTGHHGEPGELTLELILDCGGGQHVNFMGKGFQAEETASERKWRHGVT